MTVKTTPEELSRRDLIDRIGRALPKDIREDYFREMMYCRSLQESDEMLRILRAMQFLTLLMQQAPMQVATEREELERLFTATCQGFERLLQSSEANRKQLDQRLIDLPGTIAQRINPETIAFKINESLHQEFVKSTIPETARMLEVLAEQMKKSTAEFSKTASTLGSSYRGAAEEANRAIKSIRETISGAAEMAKSTAEDLLFRFHDAYWAALVGLTAGALLMGIVLGTWIARTL
jgi:type I site-specific restriction endonuclease